LHMHSAGLRPHIHCPHLAADGVKCPAELCPKALEPLEQPNKVFDQDFSVSRHSDLVSGIELVMVAIFFPP
jgi:hypothetical protein